MLSTRSAHVRTWLAGWLRVVALLAALVLLAGVPLAITARARAVMASGTQAN